MGLSGRIQRALRVLALLSLAVLGTACSTLPHWRFVPVRHKATREVGNTREGVITYHLVPVEYEDLFSLRLRSIAYLREAGDEKTIPMIQIQLGLANHSDTSVDFLPGTTWILDDDSRSLPLRGVRLNGRTGIPPSVHPNSSAIVDLIFEGPPGYRFDRLGSFRLFWAYRFKGATLRNETKFLRRPQDPYASSQYRITTEFGMTCWSWGPHWSWWGPFPHGWVAYPCIPPSRYYWSCGYLQPHIGIRVGMHWD